VTVRLLVAAAENDVIGRDGDLPWRLRADLRRFAALTRGHAVVMGRRTFESIMARLGHPLRDRRNIVISASLRDVPEGAEVVRTPAAAAELAGEDGADWFVIGGAQVYVALLPEVDVIELTRVHADVAGDARMPAGWLDGFTATSVEPGPAAEDELPFSYVRLERV
jgi:dihydrofolate reductase